MIPFIDLEAQQKRLRPNVELAIKRVLDHGQYVLGPEVFALEQKLASQAGVKHVISCANGTDALMLALMALGLQSGEAVFVPAFTFAATAEAVALLGGIPIFVDILPDTYNFSSQSLQAAIVMAQKEGLKAVGIIPVDIFGQPADYQTINAIAEEANLWVLADAAQSFGASYQGLPVGSLAHISTTSFFPNKPLGCYGEGGAVFTNDSALAEVLVSLRVHGQGKDKYHNVRVGINGRLETIQAAILLEKLTIFTEELATRQAIAKRYEQVLRGHLFTPVLAPAVTSSWAQYTVVLPPDKERANVRQTLDSKGIPTMVYYSRGLHQQPAYAHYPRTAMTATEKLCPQVLSLPMHPYLEAPTQDFITTNLLELIAKRSKSFAA